LQALLGVEGVVAIRSVLLSMLPGVLVKVGLGAPIGHEWDRFDFDTMV
jgi:hypothetical protein